MCLNSSWGSFVFRLTFSNMIAGLILLFRSLQDQYPCKHDKLPPEDWRMISNWTRRSLLRLAVSLPAGAHLSPYNALASPYRAKTKITDIQAMGLTTQTGNCLIRVITDAGLVGYGEAGASGPMARARIETMKPLLIGKDPLAIEQHFHQMTTLMHTYMAHTPTISGIDIALWDLAGKITSLPVCVLLGGPFTDSIPHLAGRGQSASERCPRASMRSRTTLIPLSVYPRLATRRLSITRSCAK